MKNIRRMLQKIEFQLFFFIVSFFLFTLPIISIENLSNPTRVFILLMASWPVVIFIMYLQDRADKE